VGGGLIKYLGSNLDLGAQIRAHHFTRVNWENLHIRSIFCKTAVSCFLLAKVRGEAEKVGEPAFLESNINFCSNFYLMEEREKTIQEILVKIKEAKEMDDWSHVNSKLLEKRLGWYEENKSNLNLQGKDARKAYTLLIKYSGIDPREVPVVYEDERKIIWRSYNWCPVLEACKRAGFDTREVCKKGWEKSVQALIEKINPKLRFSRNYERIRPYTEYCEEIIELSD